MVTRLARNRTVEAALASAFHLRSVLLLLLGLPLLLSLFSPSAPQSQGWELAVGAGLTAVGVALRLASMRRIGKKARVRRCAPEVLVCSGPFRYTRNPLYVANLAILLGMTVAGGARGSAVVALLCGLVIYTLIVLHEEQRLEEELGQPYLDYKSQVPRWFPLPRRLAPATPGEAIFSWREVLSRERFLIPGAGLGFVAVCLIRQGSIPLVRWVESASGWLRLEPRLLITIVLVIAAVIHGVHSEQQRKRRDAKKRAQSAGGVADVVRSSAVSSGSDTIDPVAPHSPTAEIQRTHGGPGSGS